MNLSHDIPNIKKIYRYYEDSQQHYIPCFLKKPLLFSIQTSFDIEPMYQIYDFVL